MSGLTSMRVIRLALIFFLILSPFPGVFAQKGTHVTRRITFQKGSNSTVIRSKARWGTSYIYLLKARAGQVLTVHLEGVPVIRIVPPGARNYGHSKALITFTTGLVPCRVMGTTS